MSDWSKYGCDYPGCMKQADFQQDLSTTPEGYHKYWCEEHDTFRRKVPRPEVKVVERVITRPEVRFIQQRPGIYGKRPGEK